MVKAFWSVSWVLRLLGEQGAGGMHVDYKLADFSHVEIDRQQTLNIIEVALGENGLT
jgi:hypothetical protein